MSDPAIMDQVIAMNPQLANMPQVREIFQSPAFREMMYAVQIFCLSRLLIKNFQRSNPESLRQMFQMSSILQQAGLGRFPLGAARHSRHQVHLSRIRTLRP